MARNVLFQAVRKERKREGRIGEDELELELG
jgi:hypothetical protein